MKITMLSVSDWAGSGFKTAQAIARHTSHDIHLISAKGNAWGHERQDLLTKRNKKKFQDRINESDIIHLKGDWPPQPRYIGLDIRGKKTIVTTSGGFARKRRYGGQERFTMNEYKSADLRTSFTPDLLYPEYGNTWTPHPIDSDDTPNIWEPSDPPIIAHSPSDRRVKDTDFLLKCLEKLKKYCKFELDIIEKVPFDECVERKREATIFADSFKQGFYANSALEAMQYGIPTVCWISPLSYRQGPQELRLCPVQTTSKTVDDFVGLFKTLLTTDLEGLSKQTKRWCDEVHGYKRIARMWDHLYKLV